MYTLWETIKQLGWPFPDMYYPTPRVVATSVFPMYSVQMVHGVSTVVLGIHQEFNEAQRSAMKLYKDHSERDFDLFIVEHDDFGGFTNVPPVLTKDYSHTHWYVSRSGYIPDLIRGGHAVNPSHVPFPICWTDPSGKLITKTNKSNWEFMEWDGIKYYNDGHDVTWTDDGTSYSEPTKVFTSRVL